MAIAYEGINLYNDPLYLYDGTLAGSGSATTGSGAIDFTATATGSLSFPVSASGALALTATATDSPHDAAS